jgi:hypothetical protein
MSINTVESQDAAFDTQKHDVMTGWLVDTK